jgi:biotin carboxyl carrier protein
MTKETKRLFLSYAKEDCSLVERFYRLAIARGFDVFMDSHNMNPGPWRSQIERAIARANVFILFLSKHVKTKVDNQTGFVESEIDYAYRLATSTAPNSFQIIPVLLDDDYRGDLRTSIFQQYDLFKDFDRQAETILSLLGDASYVRQLTDRAGAFFAARDYLGAFDILARIEERTGRSVDLDVNRAALLHNLGRTTQAITILRTICEEEPTLEAHLVLATIFAAQRRNSELQSHLDTTLVRYPQSDLARRMLQQARYGKEPLVLKSPIAGKIFFGAEVSGHQTLYWGAYEHFPVEGAPPLIRVGSRLEPWQVYCRISSMGLLHGIEAEFPCVVRAILLKEGDAVEYGQPIVVVEYTE